jgi:hypothetical protein
MLFVALEFILYIERKKFVMRTKFSDKTILNHFPFLKFYKILKYCKPTSECFWALSLLQSHFGQFEMTNLVFAGLLPALLFIAFHPYLIVGIIHEESKLLTLDEEGKMAATKTKLSGLKPYAFVVLFSLLTLVQSITKT